MIYILCAPWVIVAVGLIFTYFKEGGAAYRVNIALAFDQLGNALIGKSHKEYVSTMLGREYTRKKRYAFWRLVVDLVWLIVFGQRDHCREAYKKYG